MNKQLQQYCNADCFESVCLTFDTDWAPDFVLEDLVTELDAFRAKSTFFATNPSSVLHENESLEIAIHPNFLAGSTHGDSIVDVLGTLKEWFPNAVGARSHGLWQSSNMLRSLSQYGIRYDSNLLMYDLPYLQAFNTFYDVIRVPHLWSDASHLLAGRPLELKDLPLMTPGMKVLDIHPMLWYLNSATNENYNALKKKHPNLLTVTRTQAYEFVNLGRGVRVLMKELLESLATSDVFTYRLRDFQTDFAEQMTSDALETKANSSPFQFVTR